MTLKLIYRSVFVIMTALPCLAWAQAYPTKPIRVVVPFPAGAGGDFVTRLYGSKMSEMLGQALVVDNKSGASGKIGAESVARAAPDGYALLTVSVSHTVAQSVNKKLSYDLVKDFEPVALFASTPQILVVHPSIAAKTLRELMALAKRQPGKLTFGSSGKGSASHLSAEMLKMQAGIDLLHVPYKGTAQALADVASGQLSMMFASQVSSLVRAGKLRAIAITSSKRSVMAPDWPTLAEAGLPGYESGVWFGLLAPKATPNGIVRRLNTAVTKSAATQDLRDKLMAQSSAEPLVATPDETGAYIKAEIEKWRKLVLTLGMQEN